MLWGPPMWACGCTGNVEPHPGKECPRIKADSKSQPENNKELPIVDIELEARKIVRKGAREAAYGEPGKDFKRTATMWSGYLREKLRDDITPEDVAAMMVMLKLSRLAETPHHRDSKVDAIGYMICYDRLQD